MMKTFKEFKEDQSEGKLSGFKENQFNNVDLGGKSIPMQIKIARNRIAETLQELIDDGEIDPQMSITQVIEYLKR